MFTYNTLKTAKPLIRRKDFLLPFRCTKISHIRFLLFFPLLLFWSMAISQAQTTIWLEDFQGHAEGTIVDNDSSAWSRDVTNCDFTDVSLASKYGVNDDTYNTVDKRGSGRSFNELRPPICITVIPW